MLEPGSLQVYTATVEGATNLGVAWSASCGAVAGAGGTVTYTAPDALGDCTVSAAGRVNPSRVATAHVDVVLHAA